MSIITKIDFSGITSDNIVTSDNKKYIREDDEIFNSLKDEIAACENAQVQTEIATLQILEIKEQTKVIANEAIDTATERAETAAENAETAQTLAETAAINALEAERNVTETAENIVDIMSQGHFVIETLVSEDGNSWYRKYSDGWIEQGGNFTCPADSFVTVTYLIGFANTNYTLLATARNPEGDKICIKTKNINTTYADIGSFSISGTFGTDVSWYACGY